MGNFLTCGGEDCLNGAPPPPAAAEAARRVSSYYVDESYEIEDFSAYSRARAAFQAKKERGEEQLEVQIHNNIYEEETVVEKRESIHEVAVVAPPPPKVVTNDVKIEELRAQIYFAPGPLGISREGNMVTAVEKNSQAGYAGVRVGWAIETVNGVTFNGLVLQEKKAGHANYRITFRKVVPPMASFFRIGQKVNCRDKGATTWHAAIVCSVNPLMTKAHDSDNVYTWDEVVHAYDQDKLDADTSVFIHRRDDGIEGSFLRQQPDESPDADRQTYLKDAFLSEGEKVTLISENGNWALVRSLTTKTEGYLQKHHLASQQYVR